MAELHSYDCHVNACCVNASCVNASCQKMEVLILSELCSAACTNSEIWPCHQTLFAIANEHLTQQEVFVLTSRTDSKTTQNQHCNVEAHVDLTMWPKV